MANIIDKIRTTAEQLSLVRAEIFKIDLEASQAVHPLKGKRDRLQEELLAMLRSNDLKGIKTSAGENYTRSVRKSISVADYTKAFAWAEAQGAVRMDLKVVEARIKESGNLPDGFTIAENEFISIRKPKPEGEKDNDQNNDE